MSVRLTFSQEVYYRRKTNTYVNLRNPTYRDLRQQFTDPILTMSRDKSPSLEINRTQREMRALAAPSVRDSIFKLLMHFFAVAFLTSGDRRGATDKWFFFYLMAYAAGLYRISFCNHHWGCVRTQKKY